MRQHTMFDKRLTSVSVYELVQFKYMMHYQTFADYTDTISKDEQIYYIRFIDKSTIPVVIPNMLLSYGSK